MAPIYRYYKKGGALLFHRIMELDGSFWSTLIAAAKSTNLLMFKEVHLAADCDNDLMKYVSHAVQKRHYEAGGLKPYG